LYVWHEKLHR